VKDAHRIVGGIEGRPAAAGWAAPSLALAREAGARMVSLRADRRAFLLSCEKGSASMDHAPLLNPDPVAMRPGRDSQKVERSNARD
jgi:hypothetical protein